MIERRKHNDIAWVNLESPTEDEVRQIIEEYSIHPHIGQELLSPSVKPKVDLYKDSIYLILHFPAAKHSFSIDSTQEIDFVVGKDFLITVHYDTIDPIHKFAKEFETESIINRNGFEHAGYVLYYILKKLYKALEHELEYVQSSLREIESKIFEGQERNMVVEISKTARILLDFKQTLATHDHSLESFKAASSHLFDEDYLFKIRNLSSEYHRIRGITRRHHETLGELRETNNSLLSTKQNEVMKTLTIMAFVTFPLSLLAALFGMNTQTLPIVGQPNDFWIIVLIMAILTAVFFIFFKIRRWL